MAAYVVAAGMRQLELEVLKARYGILSDAAKETVPGRAVEAFIEELEKLTGGELAPISRWFPARRFALPASLESESEVDSFLDIGE